MMFVHVFWWLLVYTLCFHLQIKKLDDSEFRNAFSRAYVRVSLSLNILKLMYFGDALYLLRYGQLGEGVWS